MNKLLFVDTNIYLDFYRTRTDAGLALLNHLNSIQDQIIVTYQVEMEFKKHRQSVILETFQQLKSPANVARPGVLSEDRSMGALQKDIQRAAGRIKLLKERLQRMLKDPVKHDPVYQVTQRIFRKKDELNLTRENTDKKRIRSQAWRRFMLGYPPRKKDDVSIGDAINWEWIVEVAQSNADSEIHIVSRDRDYGTHFEGQSFLNDWLLHEFRDRTSLKRKIHLSNRLSNTLKQLEVVVTPEEEEEETDLVKELAQFQAFKEKKYQERLARFKEYLETVRGESFSSTEE